MWIWTAESEPNIFPHSWQRCLNALDDVLSELDDDDDDEEDDDDDDEEEEEERAALFSLNDDAELFDEVEDLSENFLLPWLKLTAERSLVSWVLLYISSSL